MTLLDDVRRDLTHGMRLLRRNPGFAAVSLTILTVAIAASVAVFSIVDAWPLRPLEIASASVAKATQQPRFRMTLLAWFSLTSLLLTAVGVYGLVAQSVERRAREIGIRMALGARAMLIVRSVARGALLTATAGALAGCAAALALGGTLKSVIYGVDARDPVSMLFAVGMLLAVAVLAALVPALRATRIDPVQVLRAE